MPPDKKDFSKSDALWERAVRVIPRGTQTLSKGPDQFVRGITPKYLVRGRGCHVWDADGHKYIDYPLALGPILLGYNYPAVVEAVSRQLREGTTFTLMHPLEVELAELLVEIIPCAEMVRFGKNGADATMAAIRIGRAATGRHHIAYCGYHGCHDWYAVTTSLNKGIPEFNRQLIHAFEYNNPQSLERLFEQFPGQIGTVIMEQPGIEPVDNFLQKVIDIAHSNGAIFVLDEICTGFRYSLGGAQEYYGIVPDLACFGKGMANGLSISAIVGKRELMNELNNIFYSLTFGGETLGLAAALATIKEIREKDVLGHIWRQGKKLRDGLRRASEETGVNLHITGNPPRSSLVFRDSNGNESAAIKSLFLQETVKRGVLFGGPVYISFSHSDEDIKKTIEASHEAMEIISKAMKEGNIEGYLEGEQIGAVFRERD
jgi:glutamate-1-semialdehyde aminotransferase